VNQEVKINDFEKMLVWPERVALLGTINTTKEYLVQLLGPSINILQTQEIDYSAFTPTVDTITALWSLEFEDKTLVTIFDDAASHVPDTWYIGVNTPVATAKLEKLLKIQIQR
jgi:hypothetical protein